jgi:predicted transcriptional regulator
VIWLLLVDLGGCYYVRRYYVIRNMAKPTGRWLQRKLWKDIFAYMDERERRSVKRLTDPKALRAVAHPTRLALLGLLRSEGPLTATRAGELLGESSASCSFHLRQLAKYGLVVEAGGGQGRQRPWKATALFTSVPEIADSPELEAASDLFRSVVAESYFEKTMRWLDARPDEPEQWQRAAHFGDTLLYLTAAELAELGEQLHALIDGYVDRLLSPELRPPDARLVSYIHLAFPLTDQSPGRGGTDQGGNTP